MIYKTGKEEIHYREFGLGRQFLLSIETERSLLHSQEPATCSYPKPHQSNPHTVPLPAETIFNLTKTELNVPAYTQQYCRHHDAAKTCQLPHQAYTNRAVLTQLHNNR
jgi:hypothetical protein